MALKTATRKHDVSNNFYGEAHVYALSEPLQGNRHIVISSNDLTPMLNRYVTGYDKKSIVLPSNRNGHVEDWVGLETFKGEMDQGVVLAQLGFELV